MPTALLSSYTPQPRQACAATGLVPIASRMLTIALSTFSKLDLLNSRLPVGGFRYHASMLPSIILMAGQCRGHQCIMSHRSHLNMAHLRSRGLVQLPRLIAPPGPYSLAPHAGSIFVQYGVCCQTTDAFST